MPHNRFRNKDDFQAEASTPYPVHKFHPQLRETLPDRHSKMKFTISLEFEPLLTVLDTRVLSSFLKREVALNSKAPPGGGRGENSVDDDGADFDGAVFDFSAGLSVSERDEVERFVEGGDLGDGWDGRGLSCATAGGSTSE